MGALTVALSLLLSGGTASADEPKLRPLIECPKSGEYAACLLAPVLPAKEYTLTRPKDYAGYEDDRIWPPYPNPRILSVTGRLNGGWVQSYRLRIERPATDDDANLSVPPPIALIGVSRTGRPVILTDRGPFEIRMQGFHVPEQETYLVAEGPWKIVARFIASSSGDTIVTTPADIGIWDEARRLCVSAVLERGRNLRLIPKGCRARPNAPPLPGTPDYTLMLLHEAWDAQARVARWIWAVPRSHWTGLPVKQIYEWNTPVVQPPAPQYAERMGNIFPVEAKLRHVRLLFPRDVDPEEDGETMADRFTGEGRQVWIYRIGDTPFLIFQTGGYEDCC